MISYLDDVQMIRTEKPPRQSSTPGLPTQAELLNFSSTPKPFKSDELTTTAKARSNLPANRRNKTLKQILTTEREQAMGLVTEGRRKGKRPLSPKSQLESDKREQERNQAVFKAGVAGAAAKAQRRRIQREQRERARAEKLKKNGGSGIVEADGQTPEIEEDEDDGDGDGEGEGEGEGDEDEDETMEIVANSSASGSGLLKQGGEEISVRDQTPTEQEKQEERLLQRKRQLPTYSTVEAPPSLRPRKKYCDVTGLVAPYTDPKTGLRYHNVEIYELIKTFGPGVDQAYLSLRGDGTQIK